MHLCTKRLNKSTCPQASVTLWQNLQNMVRAAVSVGGNVSFVFKMSDAFTNCVNGLLTGLQYLLQHCLWCMKGFHLSPWEPISSVNVF